MKWQALATDYDTTTEATNELAIAGLSELITESPHRSDPDQLVPGETFQ